MCTFFIDMHCMDEKQCGSRSDGFIRTQLIWIDSVFIFNFKTVIRPPDKSVYWKIIFFISHSKHILWAPKTHV